MVSRSSSYLTVLVGSCLLVILRALVSCRRFLCMEPHFNNVIELEPWPGFVQRITHHIALRHDLYGRLGCRAQRGSDAFCAKLGQLKITDCLGVFWPGCPVVFVGSEGQELGTRTTWADCIEQLAGGGWLTLVVDANF